MNPDGLLCVKKWLRHFFVEVDRSEFGPQNTFSVGCSAAGLALHGRIAAENVIEIHFRLR